MQNVDFANDLANNGDFIMLKTDEFKGYNLATWDDFISPYYKQLGWNKSLIFRFPLSQNVIEGLLTQYLNINVCFPLSIENIRENESGELDIKLNFAYFPLPPKKEFTNAI